MSIKYMYYIRMVCKFSTCCICNTFLSLVRLLPGLRSGGQIWIYSLLKEFGFRKLH